MCDEVEILPAGHVANRSLHPPYFVAPTPRGLLVTLSDEYSDPLRSPLTPVYTQYYDGVANIAPLALILTVLRAYCTINF